MSEVKIPFRVRGTYAEVSLKIESESPLNEDDLLACLRDGVTEDVENDLKRRASLKGLEEKLKCDDCGSRGEIQGGYAGSHHVECSKCDNEWVAE